MNPPKTTRGKDVPNIVFMWTSQHGPQNVKTHNRTTQKTKNMYFEVRKILIGMT